ncbi:MAG TPA: alkaline phosphatase family protein [Candidatus Limnocylindrales bacterium]|nr:alkaline phosphatase family protein [Candidatus Limnocylindrales bacterium]
MNRTKLLTRIINAGILLLLAGLGLSVTVAHAGAQVPRSKHVYIVAEENRSYEEIIGSSAMPYLNSIIAKGALATQFYANEHGSLENYLLVTAGQYITHNNSTTATFSVDNIERHLLAKGMTFKSYAQSLPYAGYTGLYSGAYMKRHAPLIYYNEMAKSSLIKDHQSSADLAKDIANNTLPNFAFITPDGNHDLHNCPSGITVCKQTADAWLKANIGPLLASPPFQPGGDGVLIIWSDEADLNTDNRCSATVSTGCGGRVVVTMIGPQVKAGFKSVSLYHQQSVLKTMLMLLGEETSFPGAAQTAPAMAEFFKGANSVTILAPTSSTVTSTSVRLAASAKASNPITAMKIYVNGVNKGSVSGALIDKTISLPVGSHNVVYQAWDSKGNIYKNSKAVTVQ